MKNLGVAIFAFIVSIIVAVIIGSVAHTQFVLARLPVSEPVPLSDNLSMTLFDLIGMAPLYGGLIGLGLLLGFIVAALVARFALPDAGPGTRQMGYAVAGFAAVIATLTIMQMTFGITPVAGARSFAGLMAQGFAGIAAGFAFARLTQKTA